MSEIKRKRFVYSLSLVIFVLFTLAVFYFIGRPMLKFVTDPSGFRAWVDGHGILGRLAFVGMMALQVVVAIIPGEPLEIGAGYAFGVWEGTFLCLLGAFLGSAVVLLITRRFGMKAMEALFTKERIQSMKFLHNSKKVSVLAFIVFLIPGTPKDILTYFIGLIPLRFSTWFLITCLARIPGVVATTIGGNALGLQNYQFALLAFAIALVISGIGLLIYKKISRDGSGG